ncbi:MAG: DUF4340 domain-containing protein [Candidatus Rokubacteria bacterium]|nr:DUF4340 domain-containing protein [Candidatus Rokubacteria bacterium]
MRWQTTLVAAILLALVGGFYYVYEVRMGPDREKVETRKGRVFSIETADVMAVELKRPDGTVKAAREAENWLLVDPVKARGDRGAIEETLTTVVTAKMDREIEAAPKSLADFGLDKPAAEVDLTLKDGKTLGLLIGAKSPTGVWVYAKERDKPNVFVLGESVLRDSTRPVGDFRDKTLLSFSRADLSGIEIVTAAESIALEPEGQRWKMTRPVPRPADTETVNDLLEKLGAARVREFVAEAPPSLAPYGLDRPARVVLHVGKEKDRAARALLFGKMDEAKKGVYAMRAGETSVLLVPEETWKAVPQNVAALRDKAVVAFEREKVTRIDIESPKGTVSVTKTKDAWAITAPEALPADQVEVGAVLSRLRELRAQGFLSDDATGIPRYLAKPEVKVTVHQEGAPAPTTVLLAPAPDRRGGKPTVYAAVAGKGPVVLVDDKALQGLGRTALELRDRRVFAGLEPRDVKRVRVKAGGQTVVAERSGDADWKLVEPAKGAARSTKIDDLLYMLRGLRWDEIAADKADTPARWGFDAPAFEVTMLRADGSELGTLVLGKREGERYYARTASSPVYSIQAGAVGQLPKIPDDLKG